MTFITDVFEELFFGAGSWLGILLLLSIIMALSVKTKWGGVLVLPVVVFLGIDYISNNLLWNALIMFFTSIFILVSMARNR